MVQIRLTDSFHDQLRPKVADYPRIARLPAFRDEISRRGGLVFEPEGKNRNRRNRLDVRAWIGRGREIPENGPLRGDSDCAPFYRAPLRAVVQSVQSKVLYRCCVRLGSAVDSTVYSVRPACHGSAGLFNVTSRFIEIVKLGRCCFVESSVSGVARCLQVRSRQRWCFSFDGIESRGQRLELANGMALRGTGPRILTETCLFFAKPAAVFTSPSIKQPIADDGR